MSEPVATVVTRRSFSPKYSAISLRIAGSSSIARIWGATVAFIVCCTAQKDTPADSGRQPALHYACNGRNIPRFVPAVVRMFRATRSDRFAADAWLRRLPLRRVRRQRLHFGEGIGKRRLERLRQSEIRTADQRGDGEEGEGLVHETTPIVGRESSSGTRLNSHAEA